VAGVRPVLGVCLGHQCIGEVYGGNVVRAPVLMHGKTSPIYHRREGVFADLPVPFEATRYHSLIVDRDTLPAVLKVTAETSDGLIMGLRHRELDVEGVQFHPESVLTSAGMQLLGGFLDRCARHRWRRRPSRVSPVADAGRTRGGVTDPARSPCDPVGLDLRRSVRCPAGPRAPRRGGRPRRPPGPPGSGR
jgi:hypothetical protein